MTATDHALELIVTAARAGGEKKGEQIVAFDVSEQLAITDAFLIISASNERQVGAIVDAVEDALVEHDAGAAATLLAGLEHEAHPAMEVRASIRQQPRGADEHRRVCVVAAGVGAPLDLRAELLAALLGHRQGVGVGPQQNRRAVRAAVQVRHHRCDAVAGADGERETVEGVHDPLLGHGVVEPQLGMSVYVPAEADRVIGHR